MIELKGNTYPHRNAIKSLGGKWNAAKKCWLVPDDMIERAQSIVNGAAVDDGKYQSHIYYSPVTGKEAYRNKRGRCEDAPCCGCCTF